MEALNLTNLAQALRISSFDSPNRSQRKHVKPHTYEKQLVTDRRSGRVANKPAPIYKEVLMDRVSIPRRVSKARNLSNRVYASDEARAAAVEKAENIQSGLEAYPTFVKSMLQSHVSGGFWLGLLVDFCRRTLSRRDDVMTLIDEDGGAYDTINLARKTGFSGGWKGFAVAHELADGDPLVFQLISPTKFKVYIVRADGSAQGYIFFILTNSDAWWRNKFS